MLCAFCSVVMLLLLQMFRGAAAFVCWVAAVSYKYYRCAAVIFKFPFCSENQVRSTEIFVETKWYVENEVRSTVKLKSLALPNVHYKQHQSFLSKFFTDGG